MHKEEKGEDRYQDVWKEGKTSARRSFKSSLCKIEQPSGGTGYSLLGKRGVYCIYTAKEGPSAFSRTLMETVAWCCGKERYIDSKKMKLRKKSIVLSESESESESESLSLSRFLSLSLSLSLSCQEAGVKGPRGQRVHSTRQVATACLPAVLLPLPSSSTPVRTNIHLCVSAYPRRSRYKHKKASTRPTDSHIPTIPTISIT